MFASFFYLLRENGLSISLSQWLMLLEGLEKGLHGSTLTGFYRLCRAVLLNSETEFDRFDEAFLKYFGDLSSNEELTKELADWLDHSELPETELRRLAEITGMSIPEIDELFARRLRDQKEEHNGGRKWIGTRGYTSYGNQGKTLGGIRAGGESVFHSAYRVAGERKYRDWRRDNTLDTRQFQMAFRSLRQLSSNAGGAKTELDVDATVRETCRSGGVLKLSYTQPRKNALKLLLLIDSGGSMEPYQKLCSMLFQSVSKAGHFKDLKVYYFHNYPERVLYMEPTLSGQKTLSLEWVVNNLSADYRGILVGDAEMSVDALLAKHDWYASGKKESGMDRLLRLKSRYPHIIWLHPQPRPQTGSYWSRSFDLISRQFDMYQLTLDGLAQGMKKLLVNK